MRLFAYLVTDGNGREAAEFYGRVFNVQPHVSLYGDMPADPEFPITDDLKDKVMHALIPFDEHNALMLSDNFPGAPYTVGNNLSIMYGDENPEHLKALFSALAEGGRIDTPLEATFWTPLYGQLTDKFGFTWQFNCDAPLADPQ